MKATGIITTVLKERTVKLAKEERRMQDFILQVQKPMNDGEEVGRPDTIGLTLVGDYIQLFPAIVGRKVFVIYDTSARISGSKDEVFTRNHVYRMYPAPVTEG